MDLHRTMSLGSLRNSIFAMISALLLVIAMKMGKLMFPTYEKDQMGQVKADVAVTNNVDLILAERGFIKSEEVRSMLLKDVLVDMGASMLSLPTAIAEKLGLPERGRTTLSSSAGAVAARVFKETHLEVNGRSSTFDSVELTEIDIPLLGVLPMETLGIEPDLQNQRLRMLSMNEEESYLYV